MNEPYDEGNRRAGEPKLICEGQRKSSLWIDLLPVLLMAFTGPVLLAVMFYIKPDYVSILFTNPIGLKMLVFAAAMQLIGTVAHIWWTVQGSHKAPRSVSILISLALVFCCYLPFMFTVVVGPAAVAIHERLPNR
jgi:hypothetical protein